MIAIVSSLSARRAWIEIARIVFVLPVNGVALRKESVDRNYPGMNTISYTTVALRKESVDRNKRAKPTKQTKALSLSARRAWIEILSDTSDVKAATGRSPQGERG